MKRYQSKILGVLVIVASTLLFPMARADEWNRKTVITFSGPVEIPGVHLAGWGVLPAGTYVFKILDSLTGRHIVQIFNQDETRIYATILAVPNYRLKATDKTVMTFRERQAGQPEALRAWFYPGRNWGEEFVYPKSKAIAIAKETNQPVLFTPAVVPVEVSEMQKSTDTPIVVELKKVPILAVTPAGEEVELAQVVTAPPAAEMQTEPAQSSVSNAANATAVPERLPTTASPVASMALWGLMAIGTATALFRWAKSNS